MKGGVKDRMKDFVRRIKKAFTARPNDRPRWMYSRSRHEPHQGAKECARRRRQIVKGQTYWYDRPLIPGAVLNAVNRGI